MSIVLWKTEILQIIRLWENTKSPKSELNSNPQYPKVKLGTATFSQK